jgi:hypothetical protein
MYAQGIMSMICPPLAFMSVFLSFCECGCAMTVGMMVPMMASLLWHKAMA